MNNIYKENLHIDCGEDSKECLQNTTFNDKPCDYLLLNFWNRGNNFGGVLTAYALQEIIKKEGFSCKLLNSKYDEYTKEFLSNFIDKNLNISNLYNFNELKNFSKDLKGIILGSDQVLRLEYLLGEKNLNTYLLNFSNSKDVKKIAFSASFGLDKNKFLKSKFTSKYKLNLMKKALNSFDYLSCREFSGKEIYKDIFKLNADIIIDPVFLLEKLNYEQLINNSTKNFKDKIITYILDEDSLTKNCLEKIKNDYNTEIININAKDYSVEDWLNAIKNCKYFITDSFHGTCFALIFNKNFKCIKNIGRGETRFKTLQELFQLKNIFVKNTNNINFNQFNIDYNIINKKMNVERQRCLTILKNILFNNYSNNPSANENKSINENYLNKRDNSFFYKYRILNLKNLPKLINLIKCYIMINFTKNEKKEHYKYKKNMIQLTLSDID